MDQNDINIFSQRSTTQLPIVNNLSAQARSHLSPPPPQLSNQPTISLSWCAKMSLNQDTHIKFAHRKMRNIMERSDCSLSNSLRKLYSRIGLIKSIILYNERPFCCTLTCVTSVRFLLQLATTKCTTMRNTGKGCSRYMSTANKYTILILHAHASTSITNLPFVTPSGSIELSSDMNILMPSLQIKRRQQTMIRVLWLFMLTRASKQQQKFRASSKAKHLGKLEWIRGDGFIGIGIVAEVEVAADGFVGGLVMQRRVCYQVCLQYQ